jgi:hypothetical protein
MQLLLLLSVKFRRNAAQIKIYRPQPRIDLFKRCLYRFSIRHTPMYESPGPIPLKRDSSRCSGGSAFISSRAFFGEPVDRDADCGRIVHQAFMLADETLKMPGRSGGSSCSRRIRDLPRCSGEPIAVRVDWEPAGSAAGCDGPS